MPVASRLIVSPVCPCVVIVATAKKQKRDSSDKEKEKEREKVSRPRVGGSMEAVTVAAIPDDIPAIAKGETACCVAVLRVVDNPAAVTVAHDSCCR